MISIANVVKNHNEKRDSGNKESFLPPHGYETLMMKVRRETPKNSPNQKEKQPVGTPEELIPGEIIEIYQDGKWVKTKVL